MNMLRCLAFPYISMLRPNVVDKENFQERGPFQRLIDELGGPGLLSHHERMSPGLRSAGSQTDCNFQTKMQNIGCQGAKDPSLAYPVVLMHQALYHSQTLWLFTFSDLKTIVLPSTIFGVTNALAAPVYGIPVPATQLSLVPWRFPVVFFWVWANYIPFAINNQSTAPAIAEDSINKPWRPLPRGRISANQARRLMLCLYIATPCVSIAVKGGLRQNIGLLFLGTWYNNFGGADCHPVIRNGINALGYICFTSGAMEAALAAPLPFLDTGNVSRLSQWLCMLASVVLTTVHAQDMYDQEGDAVRGRRTLPLVIGDGPARWTIAVWILIWGALCPTFWDVPFVYMGLSLGLAALVGTRTLLYRTIPSDRTTFLFWNIWISILYIMPLFPSNSST